MAKSSPKVAIVCEWLTEDGGAERVIEALHEMYPSAPIYTSIYRKNRTKWLKPIKIQEKVIPLDIRTGKLNYLPRISRRFVGPLRQKYFENLDLSDYEVVISVTGSDAKLIKAKNHLCFCHVPTQYYWGKYNEYLKNPGFGVLNPPVRKVLQKNIKKLRKNDLKFDKNIKFITISNYAKQEIKKYYKRESKVISPPVNVEFFSQGVENYNIKKGKSQTKKKGSKKMKTTKSQANTTEQQATPVKSLQQNENGKKSNIFQKLKDFYGRQTGEISKDNNYDAFDRQILNLKKFEARKRSGLNNPKKVGPSSSQKSYNSKNSEDPKSVKNVAESVSNVAQFSNAKNSEKTSYSQKIEQKFYSNLTEVEDLDTVAHLVSKYPDGFYLNYSRQVNWKNLDLPVKACRNLGLPLVLVGRGPAKKSLKKLATDSPDQKVSKQKSKKSSVEKSVASNSLSDFLALENSFEESPYMESEDPKNYEDFDKITFVNFMKKSDLRVLLELSRAFVFPSLEPFGIAPVEALAAGVPVIALKRGGSLDYVKDGKNGLFFATKSVNSLEKALKKFEKIRKDSPKSPLLNRKKVSNSVQKFSTENFKQKMQEAIDSSLK